MKHLFLLSFLTLSFLAKSQTETFMRIHQPNNQVLDIPIKLVDSVTYFTNALLANSIASRIQQDSELSYIKKSLIKTPKLADSLKRVGKYTFFAPVDASLDSLRDRQGNSYGELLSGSSGYTAATVNSELRYHIVKGAYRSADIPAGAKNLKVFTINSPEDSLFITKSPKGDIYVNGIKVDDDPKKRDITVDNGVIHKLVYNTATSVYGYLEKPDTTNIYNFIKSTKGLDSLAKMIDRAATVDPTLIPALRNNIVTIAAPLNPALVDFVKAFGGDINKISPTLIATVLKNHIALSREYSINFAIASSTTTSTGVPTLNGNKLFYTIASFASLGGRQFPALYILKDKPVPVVIPDYRFKNGVIHVVYGVILDK